MRKGCGLVFCCLALWSLLSARAAHAVPAFARREGVTCQMCHFRPPELNADGWAYLRRGLREEPGGMKGTGAMPGMGGMSAPETPAPAPAAAKRPLGEPLALRWENYFSVMGHHMLNLQRGQRPQFDAGGIDLWLAGPLNPHVSGVANPSFDIQNGGSDVDQGYGHAITKWTTQFGSGRFGQELPFAILFNQGGPQMSLTAPLVLSTPADTGTSWTPSSLVRGAEVGFVSLPRWSAYLGVGQPKLEGGDPTTAAMAAGRSRRAGVGGSDSGHIDLYGSAEYLWGSQGNSVTLYGYWGGARLASGSPSRDFHRYGAFANYYLPQTKLVGGYLTGKDTTSDGRSLRAPGFFVLAERLLTDRWAAYGRYDWLRRDLAAGGSQRITGPTLGVTWWAETEVRLTLEGQLLSTTRSPQSRALMTEFLWVF